MKAGRSISGAEKLQCVFCVLFQCIIQVLFQTAVRLTPDGCYGFVKNPPVMLDPRLMFCFSRTLRVWLFMQLTREQAPSSVVYCLIHDLVICAPLR